MSKRKYLGKAFVPFGTSPLDDVDVLVSYSLKSASDVGDGVLTGTEDSTYFFDSNLGFKGGPAGTTGYILYDNGGSSALVPNPTRYFDSGFTIQFEAQCGWVGDLTDSTTKYPIMWHEDPAVNAGYVGLSSHATLDIMGIVHRSTVGGAASTAAFASLSQKEDFTQFHISFRKGKVDVYVDKLWHASIDNSDAIGANRYDQFLFGGFNHASFNFDGGYIRNLQVIARPIMWTPSVQTVSKISMIGDSIFEQGDFDNVATQRWSGSAISQHYDTGCTPEMVRYFSENGYNVEATSYAINTTDIIVAGANDAIIEQLDGTTSNGTEFKPTWVCILGGFNDANAAGDMTDGGAFETDYQAIVDNITAASPDTKILCINLHSRRNDATYATSAANTVTTNANARIADIVADNPECYAYDWFTASGGMTGFDSTWFDADDFHLSELGSRNLGRGMAARIMEIEDLAPIT